MKTKTRSRFFILANLGLAILLLSGCAAPAAKQEEVNAKSFEAFEAELDSLRQEMKIPGMSAAVVKDDQLDTKRSALYKAGAVIGGLP